MTIHQSESDRTRPRVMADGGTTTVTKTATADSVVTREVDGEDQDLIRVPISSTRPDREGDRFDKDALDDMAERIASENPMVFDNHGLAGGFMDAIPYDSRETIGAQMDAEVESAEDGEHDLYALVNPDGTHEEGERMLRQVRDEAQPIKFSVGFRVLGYDERAEVEGDYEGDGRVFTRADLMETSRVGIPANPDASVTQGFAAKGGAGALPGYQNHPVLRMMAGMGQDGTPPNAERDAAGQAVTKSAGAPDGTKGACEADADCPDGEVCVDGECVPEDEANADPGEGKADTCPECGADVPDDANYCPKCGEELGDPGDDGGDGDGDGDGEEENADLPEEYREELRERKEAERELREELDEVRASIDEGASAETGDTTVTENAPDADPDESEAQDDEPDEENGGEGLLF